MAITQLTSISSQVAEIFELAVLTAREETLMAGLVTPYSAGGFMPRKVTLRAQATAQAVTDAVDYNNPDTMSKSTQATLTPGEVIAQAILTDQEMETDPTGRTTQAGQELGLAVAYKVDTDLLGNFSSFNVDLGPGAGTAADLQSFADCIATLRTALARPPYYVVLHPYHWHDIWAELGQPAATKVLLGDVANTALRTWTVGQWLAATWFLSANIAIDDSDDAVSGVFSREAMALDVRRPMRLEPERDASLRATELNMTMGYGHGVVYSTYGAYYTADATAPS